MPDVRIRYIKENDTDSYFHTVKYKTETKNSRIEIEQPITKEMYEQIFDLINKKPIKKNRYVVELDNGLKAEIDEFIDGDKIVIEVEFESLEQLNSFTPPNWFGSELKQKYSINKDIFSKINNSSWIDYLDKY